MALTPEQRQELMQRLQALEEQEALLMQEMEPASEEPKESKLRRGVRTAGEYAPLAGGIIGTLGAGPGLGTAAGAAAGAGIREVTRAATGDRPTALGAVGRVAGQAALGAVGGQTVKGAVRAGQLAIAPSVAKAGAKVASETAKAGATIPHPVIPTSPKAIVDFVNQHKHLTSAAKEQLSKMNPAELNQIRTVASGIMDALKMLPKEAGRLKAGVPRGLKPDLAKIKQVASKGLSQISPELGKALKSQSDAQVRKALAKTLGTSAKWIGTIGGGAAIGTAAAQMMRPAIGSIFKG